LVPPIGANDTVQALARVNSLAQTADKFDVEEVAAAALKSMHYFPSSGSNADFIFTPASLRA